jgi:hypothetical protein
MNWKLMEENQVVVSFENIIDDDLVIIVSL